MFQIAALLAILPFVIVADYLSFFSRIRDPRDAELTKASHGVAIIVFLAILFMFIGDGKIRLPNYLNPGWVNIAIVVVGFWAASWVSIGYARSYGYRDMRLVARSVAKIAFGVALPFILKNVEFLRQIMLMMHNAAGFVMLGMSGWCIITGLVKLLLVMRGPREPKIKIDIAAMPHGDAAYGDGKGLR